jgi:imidazolonepropionase-like amidohydrolase
MTRAFDRSVPRALHLNGVILPDGVERDLFVTGGQFAFDLPPGVREERPLVRGAFLLPGLVDAHAHLALNSPAPEGAPPDEVAAASARAQLEAGVLALREPASPTVPSTGVGPGVGLPRTVTAGRFLAAPGGYFPGSAIEVAADELPRAALVQLEGGEWVKIIADWVDPADGIWRPTFSSEALAAAADAVHRAGGRVAVHAADHEAVGSAIDAGVDSIEHGLGASRDQVERMAEAGIALTPTVTAVVGHWVGLVEMVGSPASEVARAARAVHGHPALVRAAAEAGVRLLAGTDSGVVPHGAIAGEVRRLVDAGVDPEQAVAAASWDARDYLGWPGIVDGAPADVVSFDADPRRDPDVLARPGVIVLAGAVVRRAADTMGS